MSISLSKDQSGSSSSSSSSEQNPNNPNHAVCYFSQLSPQPLHQSSFPISQQQLHHPQNNQTTLSHLQISNNNNNNNIPELFAPAPDTAAASPKEVNESSESSGKKVISCQHNGRHSPRGGEITQYRENQPSATHGSGRKNQMVNGNHLLNFHYDPISLPKLRAPHALPRRRHHKRKPYNRDLFLQANYRFVLLDSGTYSPEALDPDKMMIWEDIVCVKFATPFPVQCPICLDDLLCPQITSCGHIFCFPCILRYFLNSEDDHKGEIWKKCPLCFVMISSKDTYTVYIENVKQHSVGDTAEFMLLTRQKDSCVVSLKHKESVGIKKKAPDLFSKFIFTSDVELSVRNAVADLDSWLARADSGLVDDLEKLPYVCAAMEQLEQRRNYWNERRCDYENITYKYNDAQPEARDSPPTSNYVKARSRPSKFVQGDQPIADGNDKLNMLVGETLLDKGGAMLEPAEDEKDALLSLCGENNVMQTNIDGSGGGKDKDTYNFYQAVDGQHLILHPLNLKCLLHHYGSYDMLPHRISGKILQLETITQSETMRRRYRFISHFSLTTTFQLCEIDLTGSLPPDALSPFMDEIKNRENQRKRLAKKEQQEKIRADAAANAALANDMAATLPYKNIAFFSQAIAPTFSLEDFAALGGGSPSVVSSSPPLTTAIGGEKMHFATVARLGFAAGHDSPVLRIESDTLSKPKPETTNSDSSGATIGGTTRKNVGGTPSFAHVISRSKDNIPKDVEASKTNETAKKGKKATRVLLSIGGGRRY